MSRPLGMPVLDARRRMSNVHFQLVTNRQYVEKAFYHRTKNEGMTHKLEHLEINNWRFTHF